MPRLQLNLLRDYPVILGTEELRYERLSAYLIVGTTSQLWVDCWVDTGCVLSTFPEREWKCFENEITWLYSPGSSITLPWWLANVTGIGAPSIPCRIGKVSIQLLNANLRDRTPFFEII